jgi:NitT/TauT family transport system permease protein
MRKLGERRFMLLRWQLLGIISFLLLWEIGAILVKSDLILPSPARVATALYKLSGKNTFWLSIGGSFLRVLEAFILSTLIGLATGIISGIKPQARAFLNPLVVAMRATPVMALILVAMFWFPAWQVPVFSAILMAFPVMHTSTEAGVHAVDQKLLQMSNFFHVPSSLVFWRLRLPSALPYILSGAKNALGLSWKVVVAGEVLSQPRMALGTGLQEARLSIETTTVFAWAIITILLCGLSEYLFGLLADGLSVRFRQSSQEENQDLG